MTPISIQEQQANARGAVFRASADGRESFGSTAGEALDTLLAQIGPSEASSAILVQRFVPDAYFTQAQFDRMQELSGRRDSLTSAEHAELIELIEMEIDATVARIGGALHTSP